MKLLMRPRDARGHTRIGWLDSYHTFSFGDYFDPNNMGFGDLRVINDDIVQPGKGFDTHGHRDMEIVTVVLSGALEHKDNMGNGSIIRSGDVQRMSAGTGVLHSEYNPSATEPVHLLQIWILPESKGLTPGYEQVSFALAEKQNRLRLIASRDGREGSVTVQQDVNLYMSELLSGQTVDYQLGTERQAWLHVATGAIHLNGQLLEAGDGVGIPAGTDLRLEGVDEKSETLLFDLRQ